MTQLHFINKLNVYFSSFSKQISKFQLSGCKLSYLFLLQWMVHVL
jgi:hypothetical protein